MTEMNQEEDEDDDENIELLKTLINDDTPDDMIGGCLLDNLSDGIKSENDDLNKSTNSIQKITDVLGENLLILKDKDEKEDLDNDNDNETKVNPRLK